MTKTASLMTFTIAPDDPLADAHRAVSAWVAEAFRTFHHEHYLSCSRFVELKSLPSGQRLLGGKPEPSRRYVLAALAQVLHWERLRRAAGYDRNLDYHREMTVAVMNPLLRRALPLTATDLVALCRWCRGGYVSFGMPFYPIKEVTHALERYAAAHPVGPELREEMRRFEQELRSPFDRRFKPLRTRLAFLCGAESEADPAAGPPSATPIRAEAAGSPHVFRSLKRFLGLALPEGEPATATVGLDRFPLVLDSPLRAEHDYLTALFEGQHTPQDHTPPAVRGAIGAVPGRNAAARGRIALAVAERHIHALGTGGTWSLVLDPGEWRPCDNRGPLDDPFNTTGRLTGFIGTKGVAFDRSGIFDLLLYLVVRLDRLDWTWSILAEWLTAEAAAQAQLAPLTDGERHVLARLRTRSVVNLCLGRPPEKVKQLSRLIGDGANFYLKPGDAWSDAVNDDISRLPPAQADRWVAILQAGLEAKSSRPSSRWLAAVGKLVAEIGGADVQQALLRWFPLVAQGRSRDHYPPTTLAIANRAPMDVEQAAALRGLIWLVPTLPRPAELTRALAAVAGSAYQNHRAIIVGNAAVQALGELQSTAAVGQLAVLKGRLRFPTPQLEIEKALRHASTALGMPRDQVEELAVPSYGLEAVGHRRESIGIHRAELNVVGSKADLRWFDAHGKALKSVPARVKDEHPNEWKELRQALKDIRALLSAQRDRLDSLALLGRTWTICEWRDRYLNHPLVGTIARRLIWRVDGDSALFLDGKLTDVTGAPIAPKASAQITLWHPVGCASAEITAWRRRLEAVQLTQPFKQAHREIYLLTDAERATRTYSNRFAAHVLRQHQFHALSLTRGWRNPLRRAGNGTYQPPTKELPRWGLRAEFWVEGADHDDISAAGMYRQLATDQVRFYRTAAAGPGVGDGTEPLSLDEVPPLVFSEVMRDVDLFVGVASVGNDPAWQDGGPEGRYQNYWQDYSFGTLSGTAATRKAVLERLVPRLKIAKQCSFADRFLIVRGEKRTYKIHLGSGNILMEPNDQYLCIVPDAKARSTPDDLFLPFEGDAMLSIILSKAFLLAADTQIKDPTIISQINR